MPPDKPICVETEVYEGHCTNIISGTRFIVDETHKYEGKTWFEQRHYMLMMPASTWAELKAYIVKACKKYGNCQSEVSDWSKTVNVIDEQLKVKLP